MGYMASKSLRRGLSKHLWGIAFRDAPESALKQPDNSVRRTEPNDFFGILRLVHMESGKLNN